MISQECLTSINSIILRLRMTKGWNLRPVSPGKVPYFVDDKEEKVFLQERYVTYNPDKENQINPFDLYPDKLAEVMIELEAKALKDIFHISSSEEVTIFYRPYFYCSPLLFTVIAAMAHSPLDLKTT